MNTELEKIIQPIFEEIDKSAGESIFRNFRFHTSKKTKISLPYPWFCASDKEFMGLVEDPSFFYRCSKNGMTSEYVIIPLFYTQVKHEPNCQNPKVCNETFKYLTNFMFQSQKKQEEQISFMIENNFYDDRLQFFWATECQNRHMFSISSAPEIIQDETKKGTYTITQPTIKYLCSKYNGLDSVSSQAIELFSQIDDIFKESINRGELNESWQLPCILKDVLKQDYSKKK